MASGIFLEGLETLTNPLEPLLISSQKDLIPSFFKLSACELCEAWDGLLGSDSVFQ